MMSARNTMVCEFNLDRKILFFLKPFPHGWTKVEEKNIP